MFDIKVFDEWIELDSINGYYCLDDIWKMSGKPVGMAPRDWLPNFTHSMYSIMLTKTKTWANRVKVFQYCAWLDPDFKKAQDEILAEEDPIVAAALLNDIMSSLKHK